MQYYPFGMVTPGRSFAAGEGYRFGFNGQEQTDQIYGNGNLNTATFWEYDTRLGKRWNLDPVISHSISGYTAFSNSPIFYIDEFGDDKDWYKHKNKNGTTSIIWQEGDASSIEINGQKYENIGESYMSTQFTEDKVLTEVFYQNKSVDFHVVEFEKLNTEINRCHPEGYYQDIAYWEAYSKLDFEGGQWFFPRPEWMDGVFGARTYGHFQVSAEGYITDKPAIKGGTPPSFIGGPKSIPKLPKFYKGMSLEEQGKVLAARINTNNVYIKTANGANRYSLAGASHAGVPTPHYHIYQKNYLNGELKSYSQVKGAQPKQMTQQEIRMVRKYLENLGQQ